MSDIQPASDSVKLRAGAIVIGSMMGNPADRLTYWKLLEVEWDSDMRVDEGNRTMHMQMRDLMKLVGLDAGDCIAIVNNSTQKLFTRKFVTVDCSAVRPNLPNKNAYLAGLLPNGFMYMGTGDGTYFKMYTYDGESLMCTSLTSHPSLTQQGDVRVDWDAKRIPAEVDLLDILAHDHWLIGDYNPTLDSSYIVAGTIIDWYEDLCRRRGREVDLVQLWDLPKELAGLVMGYLDC
jgi:hypothetical protein